ncbi:MAG: GH92 family glycosyl hydrolase, partial [Actinobacteria bacterium]|nr:GH92 family glycosyl hydrolase [Actinomycetota bacterium]
FMPEVGSIVTDVRAYEQPFSHATEHAEPGYYSVLLGNGVGVELTAGQRVGLHRYTFPPAAESSVIVDAGRVISDADPDQHLDRPPGYARAHLDVVDARTLVGTTYGNDYTVHFAARFDHDFVPALWSSPAGVPDPSVSDVDAVGAGAALSFGASAGTVVAEVGISFVSENNAFANLHAEMKGSALRFDAIRAHTRAAWNQALHAIVVEGGTLDQKRAFYTALYHAQHHPNVFNDANGDYLGYDGGVHNIAEPPLNGSPYYANYSLWDTYRAEMPLLELIAPDRVRDMMRSLAAIVEQGHRLPRWGWMNRYADFMNGEPALQVYADAYCRGLVPSDVDPTIYGNALSLATDHPRDPDFISRGYTVGDASSTLEHSIGRFALALVADAHGDPSSRDRLLALSDNWRNLFDAGGTGFMRPRNDDGSWFGNAYLPDQGSTTYLPEAPDHWKEGTGWQYTWLVPHDFAGLLDAMGRDTAKERLGVFFGPALAAPYAGPEAQQKASLYGIAYAGNQYAPSNEHDLEAPWIYDWLGEPALGQHLQRALQSVYRATPDGLPGNDDLGTMSAWFVWSALGMYPATPGSPTYAIGSPLFAKATIRGGATIDAPLAPGAQFVAGVWVDGVAHGDVWLPKGALGSGSTIHFDMSPAPSAWGSDSTPPSASTDALGSFGCVPA